MRSDPFKKCSVKLSCEVTFLRAKKRVPDVFFHGSYNRLGCWDIKVGKG